MTDEQKIREALSSKDPLALARAAGPELAALKAAEDVLEARARAEEKPSKFALASQALVGWLALIGVALNVFQMYSNRKQFDQQRAAEESRWRQEFDRTRAADKHNAFFQVAALVTDGEVDRRLLGYALLGEFMGDKEYYDKAQLMLSERMAAETEAKDFNESHRNALRVIVRTLAQTKDCEALIQGATSVHKLRKARDVQLSGDDGISTPVEELYADFVRYIYGRALLVCGGRHDEVRLVRGEIRAALLPYVKGKDEKERRLAGNRLMMQYLRDRCLDEPQGAASECPSIFHAVQQQCQEIQKKDPKQYLFEAESCEMAKEALPKIEENAHAAARAAASEAIPTDGAGR
jgi:hypothetical protein